MRKPLSVVLPLFFLISIAGCAHQSGVSAASVGYAYDDCDFAGDCYGVLDMTTASCVFVQNPAAPARLAIIVPSQHHTTQVVNPRDSMSGSPSPDPSWNGNSSSVPPPASFPPAPVAREPVILVSPASDGRSPRTPG
ncbi:MAG TPA: hypothetical protein VK416_02920 [Thermoanaerobaculia bacterium]|nr:hypothetical protein [Thermoanaerobaculia bacterium]